MRTAIMITLGIACSVVAGCAQAIDVQVVDAQSGRPIPGAKVERRAVERPYFVVVPERREADAEGQARLKGRRGSLHATAPGYEKGHASLKTKEREITVELKPAEAKQTTIDSALPASEVRP